MQWRAPASPTSSSAQEEAVADLSGRPRMEVRGIFDSQG